MLDTGNSTGRKNSLDPAHIWAKGPFDAAYNGFNADLRWLGRVETVHCSAREEQSREDRGGRDIQVMFRSRG